MTLLQVGLWIFLATCLMGANCCSKKETPAVSGAATHQKESQKESQDDALKKKAHKAECTKDLDCASIKVDCCDCNQGGKRKAVTKSSVETENERLLIDCNDVVCLQMVSEDPSCTKKAVCRTGRCVLE